MNIIAVMTGIFTFLSSTQLILFLVIFSVFAIFFLTTRNQLFRRILLSRKVRGPSLWEVITVYGTQILKTKVHPFMIDMTKRYNNSPWGVWAGLNYYVFISDPDSFRDALKSKNLQDKTEVGYAVFHDEVGHNILASNKQEWKRRRFFYSSAFKKNFLEQSLDVIHEETKEALAKLRHYPTETDFDIRHFIESTLVLIVIKSVFYEDVVFDEEEVDDTLFYIKLIFEKAMARFIKPSFCHFSFLWSKTIDSKRHQHVKTHFSGRCCAVLDAMAQRFIKDHNSRIERPFEAIVSNNVRKPTLTRDEMLSDFLILFGAGMDTTSTALNAAIYMLALHPQVQEKAAEEVRRVLGESDRPIDAADLAQLEYLERNIKETLRLFPSAAVFLRKVAEDTNVNGTLVPKGANVIFNVIALHRNPSNFKDPLKFDPDRFLPENQKMHHQYAYLPFSSGSRDCIGKYFAMLTMKIFLSKLLQNYKILPGRGLNCVEDIKWEWNFTLNLNENFVRLVPIGHNAP